MKYRTKGTCSSSIDIEMDGNVIKSVIFTGGCNGNLKALSALAEGLTVDEVVKRLDGITCGYKGTSCSDQLARNLKALRKEA